ncbi:unnamed protein product, partial [Meganyctiphanes norvegica]
DESGVLSSEALSRRTVARFTKGSEENKMCWDRNGVDGFYSVIDAHNHFRPFGGPTVPFNEYINWMMDSGIVFSTVFGIGQLIKKKNPNDKDCCYYLHCATLDYVVTPDPHNDILNAEEYRDIYMKDEEMRKKMHLTVSATSLNLQNPINNMGVLNNLTSNFPNVFQWAGEINVFKHALAANAFFQGPRVTVEQIDSGAHDPFFKLMETRQWPVTLHCDLGCEQYDSVPLSADNPLKGCEVPDSEIALAAKTFQWWKTILGPYYVSFFDGNNRPRDNFKKVQHLQVWDTILTRFPKMKVVWAHIGLSKELRALHPMIHKYILMTLFNKHPNLYADISWDILAKLLFLNYKDESVDLLLVEHHEDMEFYENSGKLSKENATAYDRIRSTMHDKYLEYKDQLHASGSKDYLSGPTHALAIYLDLINKYPERFLSGTDFVASMGEPDEYPGLKKNPTGCMKDKANHARQVTDTSSINIFLEDTAFKKIVLGENFFKITGLDRDFQAPQIC